MDIVIAIVAVVLLTWLLHSLFWGLIFFILACLAIGAYRYSRGNGVRRY